MYRVILASICTLAVMPVCAETLYVQSVKAKVLSAPSFKADQVLELSKGDAVELIEQKGAWYQVSHSEHQGWVSRLLVAPHPPRSKVSYISGEDAETIDKGARVRASKVATAGAARGLSADERRRASTETVADFFALHRMETLSVENSEVMTFMQGVKQ